MKTYTPDETIIIDYEFDTEIVPFSNDTIVLDDDLETIVIEG